MIVMFLAAGLLCRVHGFTVETLASWEAESTAEKLFLTPDEARDLLAVCRAAVEGGCLLGLRCWEAPAPSRADQGVQAPAQGILLQRPSTDLAAADPRFPVQPPRRR